MNYYAHRREGPGGEIVWQTVWAHLTGTARRAAQCLRPVGLETAAGLAGLLHDLGKLNEDFQDYIAAGDAGKRGCVIHTFQACRYLMERYHQRDGSFSFLAAAELLAFAAGAHHGLFDCVDETRRLGLQYRAEKQDIAYDESVQAFFSLGPSQEELDGLFATAPEELERVLVRVDAAYPDGEEYAFTTGLLARLLLSAVIEGDRRDTAAFQNGITPPEWPEDMTLIWTQRLAFLEEQLRKFSGDGPVAAARRVISERCKAAAALPPGIYRLNAPTGSGKTLSALRYALTHAKLFGKRRLIFTSPLLSILEQNAKELRKYIGDDRLILEHHSNVVQTKTDGNTLDERELLVQSWDAPVIITTLVQLLNTMFDGKTTAIRRFQALCGSVIVIDEVQTVPAKLLTLFNLAIRFLSEQCGATIVLCSATQPCLEQAAHPLAETPKDILPYDEALWAAFRRTELQPPEERRLDELPEVIRAKLDETDSLLVVCNKKDEAAFLLEKTRSPDYHSFHLSAAMCMQHRRDTVAALRAALDNGEKTLCIATQVIEAGVDISFGAVLRLTAGMDSVVQAAGRCNRHGESETPRPVFLVDCTDERLGRLRDIQRGKDATRKLLEEFRFAPERLGGNLFSDAAIAFYYRALYRDMDRGEQDYAIAGPETTLFDLLATNACYADEDCAGAEDYFLRQAFRTAGTNFSVFDEDTTDIAVPYGAGRELAAKLFSERSRRDLAYRAAVVDALGQYTVSVYRYQKELLEKAHALLPVCDGGVLVLADGFYDASVGLTMQAAPQAFCEV